MRNSEVFETTKGVQLGYGLSIMLVLVLNDSLRMLRTKWKHMKSVTNLYYADDIFIIVKNQ